MWTYIDGRSGGPLKPGEHFENENGEGGRGKGELGDFLFFFFFFGRR